MVVATNTSVERGKRRWDSLRGRAVPAAVPLPVPAGGRSFRWVFLQKGSLLR